MHYVIHLYGFTSINLIHTFFPLNCTHTLDSLELVHVIFNPFFYMPDSYYTNQYIYLVFAIREIYNRYTHVKIQFDLNIFCPILRLNNKFSEHES